MNVETRLRGRPRNRWQDEVRKEMEEWKNAHANGMNE
jgi:hypothetical protein